MALITLLLACMSPCAELQAEELDQEAARLAVERGELLPLSRILAEVARAYGGKVIEVELERRKSGRYVYEIEVLTSAGKVLEVEYDGASGRMLHAEEDD